jgi:hypothetical protein
MHQLIYFVSRGKKEETWFLSQNRDPIIAAYGQMTNALNQKSSTMGAVSMGWLVQSSPQQFNKRKYCTVRVCTSDDDGEEYYNCNRSCQFSLDLAAIMMMMMMRMICIP